MPFQVDYIVEIEIKAIYYIYILYIYVYMNTSAEVAFTNDLVVARTIWSQNIRHVWCFLQMSDIGY